MPRWSISPSSPLVFPRPAVPAAIVLISENDDFELSASPQRRSSGRVGGEMVGCRAGKHREKAKGIHNACIEDRPVSGQCSNADQYGRADHAREGARYVYNSVCRELAGLMCGPGLSTHRTTTLIAHS